MTATRIVEAIDVLEDGQLCISAFVPWPPPDQLCLDRLEEGLDSGVVIAVALAAHRYPESVLAQKLLIIVRTVLAATVGVVNATLGRLPQRHSHLQRSDRQVVLHPVAHRPANDTPGMQIEDDRQVEPAFSGPHIADVTGPLLVRLICMEIPVQQVWRDVEAVIAVGRHLVFL